MAATYTPIATVTLSSSQQSITLDNIPSTYTHLRLKAVTQATTSGISVQFRLNGDTGNNYNDMNITGNGTNATSSVYSGNNYCNFTWGGAIATGSNWGTNFLDIINYNSGYNKVMISRSGSITNGTSFATHSWSSGSVVNSIYIQTYSDAFSAGSTFTLYGIKAA